MSEYEAVINEIGSFGPAQRQVFILVSLFEAPAVWGLLVHPVFASRKAPWSCDYSNGTSLDSSQSNMTDWMANNCTLFEASQCDNITYSGDYTSVVSEWDMICDRSHLTGLITTLQMVGGFLGAFLAGQISDIYGRKKVLTGVFAIFCLSSLLSSFASSWILYTVLKFIVGAAVSGTMVVNFALTMEFVTPEWRTFCGTVGFWNIGVMLMALIAYLIRSWRYMTMTVSLLGLPLLVCWWFIPESPRWLLLKGRRKEAEVILSQMAKRNKRPEPDYSKLQAFIEKQQRFRDESRKHTYWDLCRNFQMTRTTAIILYMWFACSCVYYGTTLGAGKLHGDIYLNLFFSGLVEIPGLLFVLAFNNHIGRRKTLCILLLVGGASCLSVLLVDLFGGVHLRWLSTVLSLIGKSGVSGAWAAVLISSAEFFPTVVRNIGMASSSMSSRIGSVVAPMMADLDEFHMSVPYVIYGVLGLSCGILCFFIPETLNHPLPDSLPHAEYCSCLQLYDLPMDDASLEAITKESIGVVYLDREDKVTTDNTDNKDLLTDAERQEDDKVNV